MRGVRRHSLSNGSEHVGLRHPRRPFSEKVVTDFITELLTLLPGYRLYSLRTPGAKDRRVQDHRRLNHPVAELCGESLLPGLVDRHESMAQGEVKLLDESHNEGRQQRRSDPAESFPVSER